MVEISFGEWLRRQRKAAGLTQQQLAEQMSCSTITLRKIEAEERRPSAQLVDCLAEIFNIPQDQRIDFLRFARGDWQFTPPLQIENAPWRASHTTLPILLTSFIGREKEVEEIIQSVSKNRLVTLTGAGGVGKTRLAIRLSNKMLSNFKDSVWWVELAALTDETLIPQALAKSLRVREMPDQTLNETLSNFLQSKQILLVLDNCEHLIAGSARLADRLLSTCANLKILATSREALHLRGEHIYPVPTLALPLANLKQQSIEQLTQSEAVRLFLERALAVKPDFQVTNENASAVAEICFRLDGLPLAIELAAARIRLFSLQALLERLGSRLELLRGGARDLPRRQQTLRNTIDWSYEMLNIGEQRLFALLSVFTGCTFEAVEIVGGGSKIDILDELTSLLDKSLIQQTDQATGASRLFMLETIREYAAERLEQDSEFSAAARRAHASYYADFTQHQWERLTGNEREAALIELESEIENVRTAWRYWLKEKDLEQLSKFVDSLWLLYDARAWYSATVNLTIELLNILASTQPTPERLQQQIMLQTGLARALWAIKGYTEEVEQAYARALELCESAGEIPQLFPVLRGLASFYIMRTDFGKARQMGERILHLAERLNDADMKVEGQMVMGILFRQNPEVGLDHLEKAIALYDPARQSVQRLGLGTNPGVINLTVSALFLWMLGHPDRAVQRAADAILLAQKKNHPYSLTYAQFHNGLLNLWLRNFESAQESGQAVMALADTHGFQIWNAVGSCLRGAAMVGMGLISQGIALIEQGTKSYRGLKTPPIFWPLLLHLCAGAYSAASKPAEGLTLMNEAIQTASGSSGRTLSPEFLMLKGELLLSLSSDNAAEVESLYQQALNNAREAHTPMLELRAAMRLSRLWREQGRKEQARKLLSDAYAKMTEGFATVDLKEASVLLTDLLS